MFFETSETLSMWSMQFDICETDRNESKISWESDKYIVCDMYIMTDKLLGVNERLSII